VGKLRTHGVGGVFVAGDVADHSRVLDTVDTAHRADLWTGSNAGIGSPQRLDLT
jgi:hypothetical protein